MRLNRPLLTNIGFVVLACAGGLVCALFVFNKGDFLRTASWPHELFYHRPPTEFQRPPQIGSSAPLRAETQPPDGHRSSASDSSGDPFARSAPFLKLSPTSPLRFASEGGQSSPVVPVTTAPDALLSRLNLAAPQSDFLTNALKENNQQMSPTVGIATTAENTHLRLQRFSLSKMERSPRESKASRDFVGTRKSESRPGVTQLAEPKNRVQSHSAMMAKTAKPSPQMSLEARQRTLGLPGFAPNPALLQRPSQPPAGLSR